jgi:RNA polymerase sigma-70 factor (ECF subfamily)
MISPMLENPTQSPSTAAAFDAEADLIAGIKARDSEAFEALVKQHGARMMGIAKRMLHSDQDASDALQEALICVFRKAGTFGAESRLSTWLHRITVNSCLMKLRSQRHRNDVEIEELLPTFDQTGHHIKHITAWEDGPAANAESQEVRLHVRQCIDRLPEAHRTVLLLRDIEQLDTAEVAAMVGCTENCVKTRLHRARQALRALLSPIFSVRE